MERYTTMNKLDDLSIETAEKIEKALDAAGFVKDNEFPHLVIVIGGDGTMLRAIDYYREQLDKVKFVGLHTGTLGFYTDFTYEQTDELIEYIIQNVYKEVSFEMLELKITGECSGKGRNCMDTFYAMNEVRLENNRRTQVIQLCVNDEPFEVFRGTGLNFATAPGSTGYNKSIGGPVVHPKLKGYVVTEVAAINNREFTTLQSSFVLTSKHVCKLTFDNFKDLIVGYDSSFMDLWTEYKSIDYIEVMLSDKKVNFVRYKAFPFVERVKKNFIDK